MEKAWEDCVHSNCVQFYDSVRQSGSPGLTNWSRKGLKLLSEKKWSPTSKAIEGRVRRVHRASHSTRFWQLRFTAGFEECARLASAKRRSAQAVLPLRDNMYVEHVWARCNQPGPGPRKMDWCKRPAQVSQACWASRAQNGPKWSRGGTGTGGEVVSWVCLANIKRWSYGRTTSIERLRTLAIWSLLEGCQRSNARPPIGRTGQE